MSSPSSRQWLSLVATIWLQAINGANTDFPVYSSQLKSLLSISQVQLNNLAFASDAGKLFGWLSGIAATYLPLRLVLFIGAAFSLIGYGVQFLFLAHKISSLPYWVVFLLTGLAGNGICWINTVCYLICIRNFSSCSRIVVGISTSYVGLSAKIYTTLAEAIFHRDQINRAKAYLLLNAVCPLFVAIVTTSMVRDDETKAEARPDRAFLVMISITLATGICSLLGNIGSASSGFWSREHMISLGVLLISPVFIMPAYVNFKKKIHKKERISIYNHAIVEGNEGGGGERAVVVDMKGEEVDEEIVEVKREVSFKLMVRKIDFWLYFFSYMFGATLGIVFLNNLGQIAESRGLSNATSIVSLSSSFGFFGRLIPSLLDYHFLKKGFMVSRTGFMATMMAPMVGAFFLLLSSSNLILYVSTAVIGACSGAITSIAVSTTSELFGTKNFAVNHNVIVANIPIASSLFGYMAAVLYQMEGGKKSCIGTDCYTKTFIIWGCVCCFGTILCTILYIRTSRFWCLVMKKLTSSVKVKLFH